MIPAARAPRGAGIMVALALFLALPRSTTAAQKSEVARLDALTQTPLVLIGSARPAIFRGDFDLPADARQGPEQWYLVRLRYRLWFRRDSGRGFAWVSSDTNGRTAAQIEYTTRRRRGRLDVRRTAVDLTHGQQERRSRSPRDALTFTNYLPYQGVRGGSNTWSIRLEQAGSARVARMEVLGDSAIVRTTRTPFPLSLDASSDGEESEVGGRFSVTARLAARPGYHLGDVVLRVLPESHGIQLLGQPIRRFHRFVGRRRTVFSFLARRAGSYAITVVASSDANHPNASVQVHVSPKSGSTGASPTTWALVLAPAVAVAAWLVISRRRRRRER
jgi:hypothetical protein